MAISEEKIDEVRRASDIVDIISAYLPLKKRGKSYLGLCPFHQEKTASFYVVPSKSFYHCFGCGKSGNVINFVMDQERLEYPDALRFLAQKSGIVIPESNQKKSDYDAIFDSLSLAADFYANSLADPQRGMQASEYLESRDLNQSTIKTFNLGYAPSGWDNLIKIASSHQIQPALLERAGLVIKKEGYYDRFRHRLMVPIKTISGRVVGFGGRVMPGDDGPKYINSPETEIYKKGQILFGLDLAKENIRSANEAIVVEGYFDLMALYQCGIRNVVAASGTGFTSNQAATLARFADKITLLYDPDSAGLKAAFRACGVLYSAALTPRIVTLPKGFDPDTFIRKFGKRDLVDHLNKALDIVDFVCNSINGKFIDQPLSLQKRIVNALSETIQPITDNLTRDLLLKKIFSRLDIDLRTLGNISANLPPGKSGPVPETFSGRSRPETEFLALLLSNPTYTARILDKIDSSFFVDDANSSIFELIMHLFRSGKNISISDLFDQVGKNGSRQHLTQIAMVDLEASDPDELFELHLEHFNKIATKKRLNELKILISDPETQKDEIYIKKLTREYQNLKSEVGINEPRSGQ